MQSLHSAITAPCNHLPPVYPPTSQQVEKLAHTTSRAGQGRTEHHRVSRLNVPPCIRHPLHPLRSPVPPPPAARRVLLTPPVNHHTPVAVHNSSHPAPSSRGAPPTACRDDSTLQSLHNAVTAPCSRHQHQNTALRRAAAFLSAAALLALAIPHQRGRPPPSAAKTSRPLPHPANSPTFQQVEKLASWQVGKHTTTTSTGDHPPNAAKPPTPRRTSSPYPAPTT